MTEVKGNLWDYFQRSGYCVMICTNGTVKKNGEAVMGRGCAREAKDRIKGLAKILGQRISMGQNVIHVLVPGLATFPVKHNWWEEADPKLIWQSAIRLKNLAQNAPKITFILPRPGCGNGHLKWEQVKPLLLDLPSNVWVISFPDEG